ncbi:MAG: hypothetical protein IPJ26_04315 [Bacteroidetes bacterium]|nr:hypothetical protein [Bacteroidota bacterium]
MGTAALGLAGPGGPIFHPRKANATFHLYILSVILTIRFIAIQIVSLQPLHHRGRSKKKLNFYGICNFWKQIEMKKTTTVITRGRRKKIPHHENWNTTVSASSVVGKLNIYFSL